MRNSHSSAVTNVDISTESEYTGAEVPVVVSADDMSMDTGTVVELEDPAVSGSVNASVQTDNIIGAVPPTVVSSHTQTCSSSCSFDINNFVVNNVGVQFYTGLENCEAFLTVLCSLGSAAYKLNYLYGKNPYLAVPNQLLLTVIKLRLYKTNFELCRMLNISETEVYIIFVIWTRFMSLQWREIDLWSSREAVDFFAPTDFYDKFPTTRMIIDGTEIPIKVPKAPAAQQVTFSSYKNHNTAKVLVGVTPGGLVNFVSDAYGGQPAIGR